MSRLIYSKDCANLEPMRTTYKEQQEHVDVLRFMLAELMVKQSSSVLTEDQRRLHQQGINALKAAVDAIESQVYA